MAQRKPALAGREHDRRPRATAPVATADASRRQREEPTNAPAVEAPRQWVWGQLRDRIPDLETRASALGFAVDVNASQVRLLADLQAAGMVAQRRSRV